MAHSSLRLGIGRFTTEAEIDLAVELLEKHVNRCDDDEMHMKSTQYLTELGAIISVAMFSVYVP